MSLFDPNVPTGLIKFNSDYKNVQNNMQQLDTSFGIDHYLFSDQTANNGFHNKITLPLIVGSAHPSTSAAETKIYCMQDSANLGLLDYSRGPNNAPTSPLTSLQSQTAGLTVNAGLTTNVLYVRAVTSGKRFGGFFVDWDGSAWATSNNFVSTNSIATSITANILKIKNNDTVPATNLFWTLQILRVN